jgi:deoxyribose-phosphate aldolase
VKIDADALLDKVAREVARRFSSNLPIAPSTGNRAGPPFCSVCDHRGHCMSSCGPQVGTVLDAGANRVGAAPGIGPVDAHIAGMIDHTLLKAAATKDEITFLCAEAAKYSFASVCVNPFWVPLCADMLRGHAVKVCTVVGFPLGANTAETKAAEARLAVAQGAEEIDMVINVGALKSGMVDVVENDIRAIREAIGPNIVLKVILETALLDDQEKVAAIKASKRARADFVKTSTGFSTAGATAGDVALMRRLVGDGLGVKASGGVRTRRDAVLMIESGANRIGASAGVKILHEIKGLSSGAREATSSGGY